MTDRSDGSGCFSLLNQGRLETAVRQLPTLVSISGSIGVKCWPKTFRTTGTTQRQNKKRTPTCSENKSGPDLNLLQTTKTFTFQMVSLLLPTPRGSQTPGLNTPDLMLLPPERTHKETHTHTHSFKSSDCCNCAMERKRQQRE